MEVKSVETRGARRAHVSDVGDTYGIRDSGRPMSGAQSIDGIPSPDTAAATTTKDGPS